jgi:thioredoxin
MKVIKGNEFDGAISSGTVLVDFYADWCVPCQQLSPVLEELSNQYIGKVEFTKVDIDESPELVERFGIMGVPTVIVFKDGEIVKQMTGYQPKEMYAQSIDAIL